MESGNENIKEKKSNRAISKINSGNIKINLKESFEDTDQEETIKIESRGNLSLFGDSSPKSPKRNQDEFSKSSANNGGKITAAELASECLLNTNSGRKLSNFLTSGSFKEKLRITSVESKPNIHHVYINDSLSDFQEEPLHNGESPLYRCPIDLILRSSNRRLKDDESDLNNSEITLEKAICEIGIPEPAVTKRIFVEPVFATSKFECSTKKINGYCMNILSKLSFLETSKRYSKETGLTVQIPQRKSQTSQTSIAVHDQSSESRVRANSDAQFLNPPSSTTRNSKKNLGEGSPSELKPVDDQFSEKNLISGSSTDHLSLLQTKFNKVIKAVEVKEQGTGKQAPKSPMFPSNKNKSKLGFLSTKRLDHVVDAENKDVHRETSYPKNQQFLKISDLSGLTSPTEDNKFSFSKKKSSMTLFPDSERLPFEQSKKHCAMLSAGLEELRSKKKSKLSTPQSALKHQRSVSPFESSKIPQTASRGFSKGLQNVGLKKKAHTLSQFGSVQPFDFSRLNTTKTPNKSFNTSFRPFTDLKNRVHCASNTRVDFRQQGKTGDHHQSPASVKKKKEQSSFKDVQESNLKAPGISSHLERYPRDTTLSKTNSLINQGYCRDHFRSQQRIGRLSANGVQSTIPKVKNEVRPLTQKIINKMIC